MPMTLRNVPERFPGAVWSPIPGCPGLSWSDEAEPRLCVLGHSTEGFSIASAEAAYRRNRSAPHLTVDPLLQDVAQHVDLRLAAYSLRNGPDPVQTNRDAYVWQIEIVGQAEHMDEMPRYAVDWLGEAVFGPLCELTGTPPVVEPTHHYPPEDGHLLGSEPWRFTIERWDTYSGICWHQNVPDTNVHGDPGALDWRRLDEAITTYLNGDDDMFTDADREKLDALDAKLDRLIASARQGTARDLETVRGLRKILRKLGLAR